MRALDRDANGEYVYQIDALPSAMSRRTRSSGYIQMSALIGTLSRGPYARGRPHGRPHSWRPGRRSRRHTPSEGGRSGHSNGSTGSSRRTFQSQRSKYLQEAMDRIVRSIKRSRIQHTRLVTVLRTQVFFQERQTAVNEVAS